MKISKAAKAVVAGIGAAVAAAVTTFSAVTSDGSASVADWVVVGVAVLTAIGVYRVPNSGGDQ